MTMAAFWLQTGDGVTSMQMNLLVVFVGIIALFFLGAAIGGLVLAMKLMKVQKRVMEIVEEGRGKALPIIQTVTDVMQDTAPKVKTVTTNVVEISHMARTKAQEFDATLTDLNLKTREKVTRVDGMVNSTLQTTSDVASTLEKSIRVPLREVAGVVNGFKAGLDVLMSKGRGFKTYSRTPATQVRPDHISNVEVAQWDRPHAVTVPPVTVETPRTPPAAHVPPVSAVTPMVPASPVTPVAPVAPLPPSASATERVAGTGTSTVKGISELRERELRESGKI